jgi:hypothetical protein
MDNSESLPVKADSSPNQSTEEIAPIRIPQFQKITNPKKRAWLAAYANVGTITGASRLTGMDHYHWLNKDKDYKDAFEFAKQIAGDLIEDAIIEAATGGDDVPIIYEGQIRGHYKRKSDVLRMFVLKARKPEYRDSFNPQGGSAPISLAIVYPSPPMTVIGSRSKEKTDH